jgi:hypothetical protein
MLEMYQAFMVGYVRRLNEATFNVTIGGVRIGTAKYTRLAQINLKTRIITFSRFAVENVPERGRRYLVLHELAHVKEASHNRQFWQHVERFEPNYRQVGRSLELAFQRNVKEDKHSHHQTNPATGKLEIPKLILSNPFPAYRQPEQEADGEFFDAHPPDNETDMFECLQDEFSMWDDSAEGTIYGGSDIVANPDILSVI